MASAHLGPSRRLPRGRSALAAETTAAHHRRRLYEATVALVNEHGYGATTVQEITAQAEVSTRDFYELFAGKQELVLEACDATIEATWGPLRERPVAEPAICTRRSPRRSRGWSTPSCRTQPPHAWR